MKFAAALVCLALSAAACEADRPAEAAPRIEPGVCVAGEVRDQGNLVPDLSTIVDCDKPHVYEVYDIVDVPAEALTGTTRQERIDNRDDLALPSELTDDSKQRQVFEELAEQECATSLQRVTGYDELELRDTSAEDAQVVPALRGINAPWYSVMPEKEWLEGRRQVLCSARFEEPEHTDPGRTPAKPQASPDDTMIVTTIGAESLAIEFRLCRAYDEKRRVATASRCDEPHVDEALFFFEADEVFGKKFITSISQRPTPKKFDRFDDACTDAFAQLLGPDHDAKALRGFGAVARRWTETDKTVRCSVGPVTFRTFDLPPGSLIGSGAEEIELVRAK